MYLVVSTGNSSAIGIPKCRQDRGSFVGVRHSHPSWKCVSCSYLCQQPVAVELACVLHRHLLWAWSLPPQLSFPLPLPGSFSTRSTLHSLASRGMPPNPCLKLLLLDFVIKQAIFLVAFLFLHLAQLLYFPITSVNEICGVVISQGKQHSPPPQLPSTTFERDFVFPQLQSIEFLYLDLTFIARLSAAVQSFLV